MVPPEGVDIDRSLTGRCPISHSTIEGGAGGFFCPSQYPCVYLPVPVSFGDREHRTGGGCFFLFCFLVFLLPFNDVTEKSTKPSVSYVAPSLSFLICVTREGHFQLFKFPPFFFSQFKMTKHRLRVI